MKRLNNKGFAFSTMLYGVLALIILLLMILFNSLRESKTSEEYFSAVLEEKRSSCVTEEVLLENCYSSGSNTCDPTSYYACLGISGESTSSGLIIAEDLKKLVVTSGDGLYQDSTDDKRYIYRGTNVDNYVSYSNQLWRIVGIEVDGTVKIVNVSSSINLPWDIETTSEWSGSSLNSYLNSTFFAMLSDTSFLTKKKYFVGKLDGREEAGLTELIVMERQTEYEPTEGNFGYVGLLSASEYIKASTVQDCSREVFTSISCNSWISANSSWLINPKTIVDGQPNIEAYNFDNNNRLSKSNINVSKNVLPVVYLKRTLVIESGNGTPSNPYRLKG